MFSKTTSEGRFPWSLALVMLLAACGGDAEGERVEQVPTEDSREGMEEADYGDLDPDDVGLHIAWTTNLISFDPRPESEPSRLTDVTISAHEGFDRVTFSFEPRIPGYRLELTEEAGGGCDGSEAGTETAAQLAVEFERATASDNGTELIAERDRTLDYATLARAVQTCDEGDRIRWLLGTSGESEYRLLEAFTYTHLIVDLRSR